MCLLLAPTQLQSGPSQGPPVCPQAGFKHQQDHCLRSQIPSPVSMALAWKKGSRLSSGGKLAKEIWDSPALLVSHEMLMVANKVTSFCGEDLHAEKQQSRAVMEGGQTLGFFLPKIHDCLWKQKEGCSVFEDFSESSAVV